jgi:hypothetical protein
LKPDLEDDRVGRQCQKKCRPPVDLALAFPIVEQRAQAREDAMEVGATAGMDQVQRSVESMNQVLQQATDSGQDLSEKMIRVNTEQKVADLKAEGVGRALNLLA